MFSLQNLGVIKSNHQITEKINLMLIESVFLVVSLLIHKEFVPMVKTHPRCFYIQRLVNPFCCEHSLYFIFELCFCTRLYLIHKYPLTLSKPSIKNNGVYGLDSDHLIHRNCKKKWQVYLYPDILNVIQTHLLVCFTSQGTKPIVI